jgi:hypothetical protein
MRCKPGQDFLPYDRPIAVSKIGSTSVLDEVHVGLRLIVLSDFESP